MGENWNGVETATSEHRTVGEHRAWCYQCHEWCYPGAPCSCCLESRGWEQVWMKPDGTIVDVNGDKIDGRP